MENFGLNLSAPEILNEYFKEEDTHGPRQGFYLSDLGRCPCSIYWEMKGEKIEVEDRGLQVMAVGSAIHEMYEKAIMSYCQRHPELNLVAFSENKLECPEWEATGRYDLLLLNYKTGESTLYDIKTVSPNAFYQAKYNGGSMLKEHHALQVEAYVHQLRKDGIFKNISAKIWYVSRDDLRYKEEVVEYREEDVSKISLFFGNIANALLENSPPQVEDIVFDEYKQEYAVNWMSTYCPYHHLTKGDNWQEETRKTVKDLNDGLKHERKSTKVS